MSQTIAGEAKHSKVIFCDQLPKVDPFGDSVLLIYDRVLESKSALKKWIQLFPIRYGVRAGEAVKDLENFPQHLQKISRLAQNLSHRRMTIVVLGGGSVGDFGGFVASIYKRGVRLVHVPSTWLSAIDSAHGGKTALNLGGVKNQLGTFYPASHIFLVREILLKQPAIRSREAFAEIYKVALLQGGSFWKSFSQGNVSANNLWTFLPAAIRAKYRIVEKDPTETSGYRHLLNFGHTMGHVFEALQGLPHGMAVNYGLHFALEWSFKRGLLSSSEYAKIQRAPASQFLLSPRGLLDRKKLAQVKKMLRGDKKKTSSAKVRFIFIVKPGLPKIEEVSIDEIFAEVERQMVLS